MSPGNSTIEPAGRTYLGRLAGVPDRLATAARAADGLPVSAGEWSPSDVVRHLIAVEVEVWQARLRQVAAKRNPRWPWTEPDRWTGLPSATLDELLAIHARRRDETVAHLGRLDEAGWARTGVHATFGVLDVAGLLRKALDHDEEHLAALEPR